MVETNKKGQREVRYLSAAAMEQVLLSTEVKENSACFRKILLNFTGIKEEKNPTETQAKSQKGKRRKTKLDLTFFLSLTCPVMMATTYIFKIKIVL